MQPTTTIDWNAIITTVAPIVAALGLYLQNRLTREELKENTKVTQETQVSVEKVNQAQLDYAELWELRRWKAAFDTLPECEECKDAVVRMADRRRLRPHLTPHEEHATHAP